MEKANLQLLVDTINSQNEIRDHLRRLSSMQGREGRGKGKAKAHTIIFETDYGQHLGIRKFPELQALLVDTAINWLLEEQAKNSVLLGLADKALGLVTSSKDAEATGELLDTLNNSSLTALLPMINKLAGTYNETTTIYADGKVIAQHVVEAEENRDMSGATRVMCEAKDKPEHENNLVNDDDKPYIDTPDLPYEEYNEDECEDEGPEDV